MRELYTEKGGADQLGLPAVLKDHGSQIQGTLHPNLPRQVTQPERLSVPVPAALGPVEHVAPMCPRRHMRLLQVGGRVHADGDVTRVQK